MNQLGLASEILARYIIIFIFIYAAISKIVTFKNFTNMINNLSFIPKKFSYTVSLGVIGIELCVVLLLFNKSTEFIIIGYLLGIILLSFFILFIINVIRKQLPISCNCFGYSSLIINRGDVIRNIILLCIAFIGAYVNTLTQYVVADSPIDRSMHILLIILSLNIALLIINIPYIILNLNNKQSSGKRY